MRTFWDRHWATCRQYGFTCRWGWVRACVDCIAYASVVLTLTIHPHSEVERDMGCAHWASAPYWPTGTAAGRFRSHDVSALLFEYVCQARCTRQQTGKRGPKQGPAPYSFCSWMVSSALAGITCSRQCCRRLCRRHADGQRCAELRHGVGRVHLLIAVRLLRTAKRLLLTYDRCAPVAL